MTVGSIVQDLTKDVIRIDAIPQQSLDTIRVRPVFHFITALRFCKLHTFMGSLILHAYE